MFCSNCGGPLAAGARFCSRCGTPVAHACHACGAELEPDAAFCSSCGTAQQTDADAGSERGPEELRIITCLFADLVGFTAHTERSDPEAVRERLDRYHARVRADVEGWDGSVEKLMGDGVFAVFGVPSVHEDDPERAVRAALKLQRSVADLNAAAPELDLAVRIGITTGEAIVQLDGDTTSERIIGDVVNTASRLEGVAPPGGIVVDERTYHAIRSVIDCEPMAPVTVKGKAEPVVVWRAVQARSSYGVATDDVGQADLVGRETELRVLADALDLAIGRRTPHLVTVTGEPGVGKSRLVREFWAEVDGRSDVVVRWRQGRSLPYGEGVAFWALSEIVKAEAGILESESPTEARAKLEAALARLGDDVDRTWLMRCLEPLIGAGGADGIERGELFSGWLRWIEALATDHPTVLVFEDMHWADDALADFVEHLVDWAHDVPILVVCTTRPEWYTRRPDWGGGDREASTLGLEPLSGTDAARLAASLTRRVVMSADVQQALLERSGGNPLYLIEYVALAEEQGWLDGAVADLTVPDSVYSVLAARLDLLGPDDRAVLHAASVIGKVFWAGALSFLRPTGDVPRSLRELVRRRLIRPVRRSSMAGQEEYTFAHVLARDVAYGQLTRSARSQLHRETARWLEAVVGDRAIDVAELLAHHLTTAIELGSEPDADEKARAYRYLLLASERTRSLDAATSYRYARQAADLAPTTQEKVAALLVALDVFHGDVDEALAVANETVDLSRELGDAELLVRALVTRSHRSWWIGDSAAARADLQEGLDMADDLPKGRALAELLLGAVSRYHLSGSPELALDYAERARPVVAQVGDKRLLVALLMQAGSTRLAMGNLDGIGELEDALAMSYDMGDTVRVMSTANNLATFLGNNGRPLAAIEVIEEAIDHGRERGVGTFVEWSHGTLMESLASLGRLDEIERIAHELAASDRRRGGTQVGRMADNWLSWVASMRDEPARAWEIGERWIGPSKAVGDPQALGPALASELHYAWRVGRPRSELRAMADAYAAFAEDQPLYVSIDVADVTPALLDLGFVDTAREVASRIGKHLEWAAAVRESQLALIDESDGDPASGLARLEHPIALADERSMIVHAIRMRTAAGRMASALGRNDEADAYLDRALSDATELGLTYLARLARQARGDQAHAEQA